jgi:hypothetical protein
VDAGAFRAAAASMRTVVPCLVEPLTPQEAAAIHRVQGLAAWLDGDTEAARRDFAAARAADPTWQFPTTMIPVGNPVRALYDGAAALPGGDHIPAAKAAKPWIDGAPGRLRPAGRPVVFQLVHGREAIQTTWLAANDPLPTYHRADEGTRAPLLVGAGVAALGAGALAFWASRLEADPPVPTSEEDLQGIAATNHALAISASGLGVAAVGVGVSAFVVGRW